jgi:glycosyltransferase involved in cell wall biosynthesis
LLLACVAMAPDALPGLTVVLVSFDEAEHLPAAVFRATAAAERCAAAHEIVVVDAGSTDESIAVAAATAARDPRVRLVVHAQALGYGAALRSGIAAARMPWVLLADTGLQFDVRDLEDMLPLTASADLVVGWRILPQGPVGSRARAAIRNRFLRAAFDLRVHDVDCAFRLVRRELLAHLDLRASGTLVGAELLLKSRAAGARTVEAPLRHAQIAARRPTARTLREVVDLRRALHNGAVGA